MPSEDCKVEISFNPFVENSLKLDNYDCLLNMEQVKLNHSCFFIHFSQIDAQNEEQEDFVAGQVHILHQNGTKVKDSIADEAIFQNDAMKAKLKELLNDESKVYWVFL